MFDQIKDEVQWTGDDTFTWNGLQGKVKGTGNAEIEHTQVHHFFFP